MNSKLREALLDHFTEGAPSYKSANEAVQAQARLQTEAVEKAIRKAVAEDMLEIVDGLEIDMEATEKHIRKAMPDESEDAIAERLLSANIDADDRKDTLDDVRQKIKEWSQS